MIGPLHSIDRRARLPVGLLLLVAIVSASCQSVLSRKYEYEEDIYLALDGSATVYVNASVAALVALRGVDLDPDPRARLDRNRVRALFESPVTHVANVSTSRRENRRYVHLRLDVPDVDRLDEASPFAWSDYQVQRQDATYRYRQVIGSAAGRDVGNVGWDGSELVAVRLHLPSRVPFHNSPTRTIERGNIIVWEQPLAARLRGDALDIQVEMETQSILTRTLTLFGFMILLAALTFAAAIWLVRRRGRQTRGEPHEQSPPTAA
jgi:hypothetical protein